MPYVKRDETDRIVAVYQSLVEDGLQQVHPDDPELQDFLRTTSPTEDPQHKWLESDLALARVLEDLIDMLIERNVIRFTDFPDAAQKKLLARRGLRREFAYVEGLFSPDDFFDDGTGGGGFL